MKSYRVLAYSAPLEAVERPVPEPRGTEVVLDVLAAGVCHSDVHTWEGGYDLGGGKPAFRMPLPLVLGHETVGRVRAAGPEAAGVKSGDVRLIYPWIGCGACALCGGGEDHLCSKPHAIGMTREGGYADCIVVPHSRFLVDIAGLDPAAAAPLACSGLTTYGALAKMQPWLGRGAIGIIGAGGLGLMALRLLAALGGRGAVVADIDSRKREAALAAGALAVVDAAAPDAAAALVRAAGSPLGAILDLVGSTDSARIAFGAIAKGGKIVVVGLFGGIAPWPLALIPIKSVTIEGAYTGSLANLGELVALVTKHGVPSIPLARRPLSEATAALEDLKAGRTIGRSILIPEGAAAQ